MRWACSKVVRVVACAAAVALVLGGCHASRETGSPAEGGRWAPMRGKGTGIDGGEDASPINRVELASGLVLEDVRLGTGKECLDPESVVTINFRAMTKQDGRVFEATDGSGPQAYPIRRLMRGLQDGLPGMRVGGIRRLTIPWRLAYGDREIKQAGAMIPARSDVVFEVELVGVD